MINELINNYQEEYLKDAVKSIYRNRHMNEIKEINFNESDVKNILNYFKKDIRQLNTQTSIEILNHLTEHAKNNREQIILETKKNPVIVEAVLVDFINYIGLINCIDYCLYTIDLNKK